MPELAKAYEASAVEDRLYKQWIERAYFKATPAKVKEDRSNAFSIVIPPPNVTGILTMGHVLNNTIQDILCRKARMEGKEVLWLPGTDHAGIATQTVVERKIKKELGKTRQELGREAFLKEVWAWKEKHGGIIIQQLKKLGCSCDWDRESFTMDADYSSWVWKAFKELYNDGKGYIRRDKRMVNWCPVSLTALSDEEVIPTPQKSILYYVKYEIYNHAGEPINEQITVATTRPETIMGDTAIAVHPNDKRYKKWVEKKTLYLARRPLAPDLIPIIPDEAIDPEFGTGTLKVTPAHDKVDFEIGKRRWGYKLKEHTIDVLTPHGKIDCPQEEQLHELDRFEARKKAAELLKERGALVKEEPYENTVGFSERGGVPIEPRLSDQWFLEYGFAAEPARKVVKESLIRFFPNRWEKVYEHWMENLQDWCISRQLWWGHQIPVWHKEGQDPKCPVNQNGEIDEEARKKLEADGWKQDEDVLDTWFSAWLWPFATMTDPKKNDLTLLNAFYPTNVLVTGPDIIFFWVARMIMAGFFFHPKQETTLQTRGNETKEEPIDLDQAIPFQDVYFTGIIRDKQGRKMSKSLGNSPDPLDLIAKYGADGLRFGLMRIAPQGQDIHFDEKQIEEGRNFCNKLWNACRFRLMYGKADPHANPYAQEKHLERYCKAILFKLGNLTGEVNEKYDGKQKYQFSAVAGALYDFVWKDFCSNFLEKAKVDFAAESNAAQKQVFATFDYILSHILRLLHPFMPFITEELWLSLELGQAEQERHTIQFAQWPVANPSYKNFEQEAQQEDTLDKIAEAGRQLWAQAQVQDHRKLQMLFFSRHTSLGQEDCQRLAHLMQVETVKQVGQKPLKSLMAPMPFGELYLPLEGQIDLNKERQRAQKQLTKIENDLTLTLKKLENKQAPADKLAEWEKQAQELSNQLKTQKRYLEELESFSLA